MNTLALDPKQSLLDWISQHASRPVEGGLRSDTPILEQRIITSLHIMELILFIEKTAGRPVNVQQLKPGAFRSVDSMLDAFFVDAP